MVFFFEVFIFGYSNIMVKKYRTVYLKDLIKINYDWIEIGKYRRIKDHYII